MVTWKVIHLRKLRLGNSMGKKTFIFVPDYDATIGNLSELLHFALLKAERLNKKVLFIRKKVFFDSVFRRFLKYKQLKGIFHLRGKNLMPNNNVQKWIISFYFGFLLLIMNLIPAALYKLKLKRSFSFKTFGCGYKDLFNINQASTFNVDEFKSLDWPALLEKKQDLSFSKNDEKKFEHNLRQMGVLDHQPYVCLHIRTGFFHHDYETSSYRNSNIKNYLKALEYLHSQGYAIIRLGDPVPLGFNELYIDYPNSKFKSELMDLYLIKNCFFYLGTNSGIFDTALLLGTPTLAVNVSDFLFSKPYKSCDLFIYKRIFSKQKNKILSFQEAFNEPCFINSNTNGEFLKKFYQHYEIYENSEEDIFEATKEMVNNLNLTTKETEYQLLFKSNLNKAILHWIKNDAHFKECLGDAYRIMIKTFFNGRIGRSFSEKYIFDDSVSKK